MGAFRLAYRRSAFAAANDRQSRPDTSGGPNVIAYSLMSGAVATSAGALASLAAAGPVRFAVWCAVTGATSVASGLVHDSAVMGACWIGVCQWMRRSRP